MSNDPKLQNPEARPAAKKDEKPTPKPPEQAGLSLRDHFAGVALQGLSARPGASTKPADLAADAFTLADAMLAARPKGEA